MAVCVSLVMIVSVIVCVTHQYFWKYFEIGPGLRNEKYGTGPGVASPYLQSPPILSLISAYRISLPPRPQPSTPSLYTPINITASGKQTTSLDQIPACENSSATAHLTLVHGYEHGRGKAAVAGYAFRHG